MQVTVERMNKEETINDALSFQSDDNSIFWREPLFDPRWYPELDRAKGFDAPWPERKAYLTDALGKIYDDNIDALDTKVKACQQTWESNKDKITQMFSKVFEINAKDILNDIKVSVSLNIICPRDLETHWMSTFWRANDANFLETLIHESIHFAWFYVWQKHFHDNPQEYNTPHMKWLLSEMVVDTLLRNTELKTLFRNYKYSAYSYFYDMKVGDRCVLDILSEIYNTHTLTDFMELAYDFIQKNQEEIKAQIK